MSAPKKRIPTDQPLTGLQSAAFAGLEIGGLPPGPSETTAPAEGKERVVKPTKLGRVVLRKEKDGRGGKTVIVLHDFATHLTLPFLDDLTKRLRSACGTGGTRRERAIEIQGDQAGRIAEFLEAEGFQVAGIR